MLPDVHAMVVIDLAYFAGVAEMTLSCLLSVSAEQWSSCCWLQDLTDLLQNLLMNISFGCPVLRSCPLKTFC